MQLTHIVVCISEIKACGWPYGEWRRLLASVGLFCKTISTCTPYWNGLQLEVRTQVWLGEFGQY